MQKRNIALVLSSGGARGLAHIGAIEELVKNGYTITSIAGASMGSLVGGMFAAGQLETLSFDPWGRRRNPTDWSFTNVPASFLFDRGYTGHEHLDKFGLINMNGRVYDPFLGRFLSPDPILQNPGNSQNYNRYSYCLNNPLIYTDPSGYVVSKGVKPEGWNISGFSSISFNGGYAGFIGAGSGNHWSDAYRSDYGNYMLMSGSTFINSYGSDKYSMYYNATVYGTGYTNDSRGTGFWINWSSSKPFGETRMLTEPGSDNKQAIVAGIELGSTFVPFTNDKSGLNGKSKTDDVTITNINSRKYFQTPGLAVKGYSTNTYKKGKSNVETVINARTGKLESTNIYNEYSMISRGEDGSITLGAKYLSFGFAADGTYIIDLSFPTPGNSSLGTTIYYDPKVFENNIKLIMNTIGDGLYNSPWINFAPYTPVLEYGL